MQSVAQVGQQNIEKVTTESSTEGNGVIRLLLKQEMLFLNLHIFAKLPLYGREVKLRKKNKFSTPLAYFETNFIKYTLQTI